MTQLNKAFFNRPGEVVAKELLGKYVVRKKGQKVWSDMITEVELYDGFDDLASHASKGQTQRNAPMFGPAGHLYIYLIYGIHLMLNITVREENYPSAILIRALKSVSGPGRVGKRLELSLDISGKAASKETGIWFEDKGVVVNKITKTPRIGVDYAGAEWSQKPRRYLLEKWST